MEMEVAVGGQGYVFRGQAPGVAGKVFQACGVALPQVLRSCRSFSRFASGGEKAYHYAVFELATSPEWITSASIV
jgi:hypothetical protein